jgi:magnesium-transporting ATPase (P-type)
MSVLVKRLKSQAVEVYVKGAPEVMSEICVPESSTASVGSGTGLQLICRMYQCRRTLTRSWPITPVTVSGSLLLPPRAMRN